MIKLEKIFLIKTLAIFLIFLMFQGDFSVYAYQGEKKAGHSPGKERKINEMPEATPVVKEKFEPGKKIIEKAGEKKKKKIPVFLVGAGIVVVVTAILLLVKKKKKDTTPAIIDYAQEVSDSIEWIEIPAGEFLMGDNFNDFGSYETPVHTVYLSDYKISKYEVTFDQYDKFCDATGRSKPDDWGWGRGNMPVIDVSWYDAKAFCDWLSQKTGKNIHLPTEAQWEKAARGTDQRRYPWGNSPPNSSNSNSENRLGRTQPVGSYPLGVSPYGVHDMDGNVWEWCSDYFSETYYSNSPRDNPTGPDNGNERVQYIFCLSPYPSVMAMDWLEVTV